MPQLWETAYINVRKQIDLARGARAGVKETGWRGLIAVFAIVLKAVEAIAIKTGDLTSEDKKKIAVKAINDLVNIPVMPEAVEAVVIGWGVDVTITVMNTLIGKFWFYVQGVGNNKPAVLPKP